MSCSYREELGSAAAQRGGGWRLGRGAVGRHGPRPGGRRPGRALNRAGKGGSPFIKVYCSLSSEDGRACEATPLEQSSSAAAQKRFGSWRRRRLPDDDVHWPEPSWLLTPVLTPITQLISLKTQGSRFSQARYSQRSLSSASLESDESPRRKGHAGCRFSRAHFT